MKLSLCAAADDIDLAARALTGAALQAARVALRVSDALHAMSAWLRDVSCALSGDERAWDPPKPNGARPSGWSVCR